MIQFFKNIFGFAPQVNFKDLVLSGAHIIDVRTKSEFQQGHLKKSVNIPLDKISSQTSKFKPNDTIIVCCASGMRSSQAKNILKSKGFVNVHNGGGWSSLQRKIQ